MIGICSSQTAIQAFRKLSPPRISIALAQPLDYARFIASLNLRLL
jgi:hypothetical protein